MKGGFCVCAHQVFEEWLKENDKILRFRFFFKFLLAFIFICLFLFGFINCWYQVFVSVFHMDRDLAAMMHD